MKFLYEPIPVLEGIDILQVDNPACLPICYCWTYCNNHGCAGGYNPK